MDSTKLNLAWSKWIDAIYNNLKEPIYEYCIQFTQPSLEHRLLVIGWYVDDNMIEHDFTDKEKLAQLLLCFLRNKISLRSSPYLSPPEHTQLEYIRQCVLELAHAFQSPSDFLFHWVNFKSSFPSRSEKTVEESSTTHPANLHSESTSQCVLFCLQLQKKRVKKSSKPSKRSKITKTSNSRKINSSATIVDTFSELSELQRQLWDQFTTERTHIFIN
jgi:hypothetical protein